MTIEESYLKSKEVAKALLQKDKYHSPVIMFFGNKTRIMGFPFRNDKEKYIQFELIKSILKEKKDITAYILIIETWVKKFDDINKIEELKPASQYEDRTEALMVSLIYRDGRNRINTIPFHRENNEIILEEEKEIKDMKGEGNLFNLFEK